MRFRSLSALLILGLTSSLASDASAADWLRFRGPNGSGISADTDAVPTSWDSEKNVKWKAALPGPGVSSPIVVGDRVFVTCWSGYGVDRGSPGNMEDLQRHLVCVDRVSGKVLWDRAVKAVLPEDPFSGMGVPAHGYASHTPVSDGKNVYVFFGKSGALAFDLDGKQLWQTGVGTESDPRRWGSSSSPILFGNLLIVTASAESEAVVALNTETGEEVWRAEAAGLANVWGTPLLVKVDDERTDLVLGVPYEIWGFNPENGKLRWYCEAPAGDQFQSSVVVVDNVAYAVEGRGGGSIAVRVGGTGNVTESHKVWTGRDSTRFCTPVVYENRIYYFSGSVAACVDAQTGDRVFQGRLTSSGGGSTPDDSRPGERGGVPDAPGGRGFGGRGFGGGSSDYASPVIATGHVYYVRSSGETVVLKAGTEFEQVAVNPSPGPGETFGGTPAISNGELFLRSSGHLYCIADASGQ